MGFLGLSWVWSYFVSVFSFSFASSDFFYSEPLVKVVDKSELTLITSEQQPLIKETYWQAIPRVLGFQYHRKKLVLDLDETLISSSQKHCFSYDLCVLVTLAGAQSTFFVKKRPHVDLFLEKVSEWFELVIFTASLSPYANAVIDRIDPKRRINRRYYRQSCTNKSGNYLKNLNTVCRDLSQVVIVDNSPVAFSLNKENGIHIPDYFGTNPEDEYLLHLLPLLEKVRDAVDVRTALLEYPNGVCGMKSSPELTMKRSNRV